MLFATIVNAIEIPNDLLKSLENQNIVFWLTGNAMGIIRKKGLVFPDNFVETISLFLLCNVEKHKAQERELLLVDSNEKETFLNIVKWMMVLDKENLKIKYVENKKGK